MDGADGHADAHADAAVLRDAAAGAGVPPALLSAGPESSNGVRQRRLCPAAGLMLASIQGRKRVIDPAGIALAPLHFS